MQVRIIGTDLPGRRFDTGAGGHRYDDVRVGVQRGRAVEQLVAGDAPEAVFDLELAPAGDRDARGPYAHGRPGGRFLYLAWVAGPDQEMFRRAKLMLADIPEAAWVAAGAPGHVLEGRLGLTDGCGGPLCARVPAASIRWRATT